MRRSRGGFSLVELLVVMAVMGVLAGLLLPALSRSKAKAEGVSCASNVKQLQVAWTLYAEEGSDWLVNNHGVPETLSRRETWANNVQDWEASEDNTNVVLLTGSKLGAYTGRSAKIYKCPSDREPGPNGVRIRSMAMNAMVGNPGVLTNQFNPEFEQFFKGAQVVKPAQTFVFLDEQADTLNDGFFVNRLNQEIWGNVPGSYHAGAANLSFVDGHVETRKWRVAATVQPVRRSRIAPFAAAPPEDFNWLKERTSVRK